MVGFPHSEILGSKLVRSSPRLIAAYYVLHRLHAPRHPLDALKALDRSHYRCPQLSRPRSCNAAVCHRARTIAASERCGYFDRSDQKTRIHVQCCLSPGCGSNKQQSISLRCRKIRPARSRGRARAKLALYERRCSVKEVGGARSGSNRRPDACKAPLSQLSYGPIPVPHRRQTMVGPGRLELPTSRLSGVRSNHLSYGPSGSRQRDRHQPANARHMRPALTRE